MSALEIPDAAGRAGAAAYDALPDLLDSSDDVVRAILEAAAPHLVAAELERLAGLDPMASTDALFDEADRSRLFDRATDLRFGAEKEQS